STRNPTRSNRPSRRRQNLDRQESENRAAPTSRSGQRTRRDPQETQPTIPTLIQQMVQARAPAIRAIGEPTAWNARSQDPYRISQPNEIRWKIQNMVNRDRGRASHSPHATSNQPDP